MKQNSVFICQQCGYQSPSWLGRCPECDTWNSLSETLIERAADKVQSKSKKLQLVSFDQIKSQSLSRLSTQIPEFDRVLGGGFVPGSVILIAGDPGIGKSTLLLQLAINAASTGKKILYVSGEESASQIKIRADRINSKLKLKNLYLINETDVNAIIRAAEELQPQILIVDSIQTMEIEELTGSPGSIGQVRESAIRFHRLAKQSQISLFIVGHVTKEGAVAGPKTVEHLVDTVLYLEGEEFRSYRMLRSVKNRFGATYEVGIFEMRDSGLFGLDNPSEVFLESRQKSSSGSVVVATITGTRPVLVEVQALASPANQTIAKRVSTGVDYNRVQMILAVLAKNLKIPLASFDIYVNVAGGLKIYEPAVDLGIAIAIASSFKNIAVYNKLVAIGEIGLLGELRPVSNLDRRSNEAKKLGFTQFLSYKTAKNIKEAVDIALK